MAAGLLGVAARRLLLLGASTGVAYGTVQGKVWENGEKSKELLKGLKDTLSESYEIMRHGSTANVSL